MPKAKNSAENIPASSWNYRVLEFVTADGEARRSIHEVHYVNGVPKGYSEQPAAVVWDTDEGDAAALLMLERMRDAVTKPILVEKDFHANDSGRNDLLSTR